jgi:hypothetical protein
LRIRPRACPEDTPPGSTEKRIAKVSPSIPQTAEREKVPCRKRQ